MNFDYTNEFGKVKLSNSLLINGFVSLFDDIQSPYFTRNDTQLSYMDLYYAFAIQFTKDNKDIINRFEKTVLLTQILDVWKY